MSNKLKIPDEVDVQVGARVRLLRKQRNMSQTHLGEAIGVSFQQLQKYERASNRMSISMLSRIAATLGTTVADIIGEQDDGRRVFSDIAEVVAQPMVLELVRAFSRLPKAAQRRAIVELVATLAEND